MSNMIDTKLYNDISSNSNIITGDEYKRLVCTIAKVAADMVKQTLGPYGATTVIDDGSGFTYPSKDGWSCLNKLQFTDPTYNTIYAMLKKVSFNSATTVGDGTTTAMVAANNFLENMYIQAIPSLTEDGSQFRQASFLEAMNEITTEVIERLKTNPNIIQIDKDGDYEDIYKIAYIATNGNEKIAEIIRDIYKETSNPNINVSIEKIPETTYEVQKGYKFDARVLNFPAYINSTNSKIEYKDSPRKVVIFDHNVNFQTHQVLIAAISHMMSRDGSEMIIMAPYFDDIISGWIDTTIQKLIQSRQVPNIMLVQIPITAEIHRMTIGDLGVMTNAQVFDSGKVKAFNLLHHKQTSETEIDDSLLGLEGYNYNSPEEIITCCVGNINSITFTKTDGFLQDYIEIANPTIYKALLDDADDQYKSNMARATKIIGGMLDKEYLFNQMRYIRLKGNTGSIQVGGLSDLQQRCDKDSIDDAVLACKSAFENGYVRGMNLELISILYDMCTEYSEDSYNSEIIDALIYAFAETTISVMKNKYEDDGYLRHITISDYKETEIQDYWGNDKMVKYHHPRYNHREILHKCIVDKEKAYDYNLRTETLNPKGSWTVINSTATDIEILRAVANILTTIMTSSQFISMTRRFDEQRNTEATLRSRLDNEILFTSTKTKAIIDTLKENNSEDISVSISTL